MPNENPEVDAYIARAAPFARPILTHLRRIVHAGCPAVEETMKWSRPHFGYRGSLAGMAAFKEHCAFGFWKNDLVVGATQGARDDAMGHFGRITKVSDLPNEKKLLALVRKAAALNEQGIKVARPPRPKGPRTIETPVDLAAALKKNPQARRTFESFSYSHRKEYIEWLIGAKREETRRRRLETALQWLGEGKSHNWRYERKPV